MDWRPTSHVGTDCAVTPPGRARSRAAPRRPRGHAPWHGKFGFIEGGGFSVLNADSHRDVLDLMADYPLFGLVTWDVRPSLEFKEGADTVRAKLVEAQAAMAGR